MKTDICIECPGSQWGDSSFCSVHQEKIQQVQSCPQWEEKLFKEKDGQLSMHDPEQIMDIIQRTEEDVRDYRWMTKEIDKLEADLNNPEIHNKLTAKWGIEAVMPNGKGQRSSVNEKRYKRQMERLERLQEKVGRINKAAEKITEERKLTVLECMLDGVKMNMIAKHVGVSRQTLNEIRREIITSLATDIYREELEKA
ncbi:hypothetical protein MUG87_01705 [Ectobacillus sp. JY-23]|uniref:hypothetical protein n=1 Tax=Ectobacillus sp. JY-23 TaxID=2933872 RepID=UPI001FF28B4F|nr:hypothetical protein [Ectobacillus sp. JY-23]UOY92885.1 hypothetical protein MUG87_01705 [Ectobacillus sp. JY-23]